MEIELKPEKVKKFVEVEEEESFIHLRLTRKEFAALVEVAGHIWAGIAEHEGRFGVTTCYTTKEQAAIIRNIAFAIYDKRSL